MDSGTHNHRCIYCGSPGVSDEHIIPYSLGGEEKIAKGSCEQCARTTSKIELSVARKSYELIRSTSGIKTRRKKRRAKNVNVHLMFAGDKIKHVSVPIREAPLNFIAQHYLDLNGNFFTDYLTTSANITESDCPEESRKKMNAIISRTPGAIGGQFVPFEFSTIEFPRLLWKISYCEFWKASPKSLMESHVHERIFGKSGERLFTKIIDWKNPGPAITAFFDIISDPDKVHISGDVDAVSFSYTRPEDRHRNIYCEIHFPKTLRLPVYITKIKNHEGKELSLQ